MSKAFDQYFADRVQASDQELKAKLASMDKRCKALPSRFKRALDLVLAFSLGAGSMLAWLYWVTWTIK